MKKGELIVGGVVVAGAVGAFFWWRHRQAAAAATQAAMTAQQQAAYAQLQQSVLAYLSSVPQTTATPTPAGTSLNQQQIGQLQAAQAASTTESVTPTTGADAVLVGVGGSSARAAQLHKLTQTVSAGLLSMDELGAVNNEILQEQGQYVGTLSTGDIQNAFNAVLRKYNIK